MWENCFYVGGEDDGVLEAEGKSVGVALCWELMRSQTARRLRGRVDVVLAGSGWWSVMDWRPRAVFRRLEARNAALARRAAESYSTYVGAPLAHAAHAGRARMRVAVVAAALSGPLRGLHGRLRRRRHGPGQSRLERGRGGRGRRGQRRAQRAAGRAAEALLAPPPRPAPRSHLELSAPPRQALVPPPRRSRGAAARGAGAPRRPARPRLSLPLCGPPSAGPDASRRSDTRGTRRGDEPRSAPPWPV
jgi:predicted amidohydrolase